MASTVTITNLDLEAIRNRTPGLWATARYSAGPFSIALDIIGKTDGGLRMRQPEGVTLKHKAVTKTANTIRDAFWGEVALHEKARQTRSEEARKAQEDAQSWYRKFREAYDEARRHTNNAHQYQHQYRDQEQRRQRSNPFASKPTLKWDVLGLPGPVDKIHALNAYRVAAFGAHPDRNGGDHRRMASINAAWDEIKQAMGW